MKGKTVLITGATNGIGFVTARELARQGATTVLVGRNAEKTRLTVSEIVRQTGNPNVASIIGDLSVMSQVRAVAQAFKERYPRLDVLVNNAGAMFMERTETSDGIEMTWALNHLSYFVLTRELLDVLKNSAPARIVNVASNAHVRAKINFDDVQFKKRYGGFAVYGQSKLANIMFTYELARRLAGARVTAHSLHPGFVATGFGHNNKSPFIRLGMTLLMKFGSISPDKGAETQIYLASAPGLDGLTGKYWDSRQTVQSSPASYIEADQKKLWLMTEKMVGAG